jgi:hypothetical protein
MPLPPGARLGPYEIGDLIGAGGMGEVYRAKDGRLGRSVAVKVIRASGIADGERVRRFEQEARAAGVLNHPNILAIYDVGTHEGAPYLVSELLEGETLRMRLAAGPLSPPKAVDCAAQIASGLSAAHAKGIVHRDLKPDNLFLTRDGRVKILDFGLAKLVENGMVLDHGSHASTLDSPTEPGRFVGTVNYMSPEAIRGQPVDHRADVFSFGAVLYEMLTARRAFEGASAIETMNAALKEEPPEPDVSAWPRGLDLIVRRCLEKDPDHRFQSANDLAFHLLTLSAASVSGLRTRVPVVPRRRPGRWLAAGLAAAVAVGALAFWLGTRAGRAAPPTYQQLTFRRGLVMSARFAPDGHTVVYGASWEGKPVALYSTRAESPESHRLDLPAGDILAIAPSGEMAISLGRRHTTGAITSGTLARAPMVGGAPREVMADVESADWSPDGRHLAVARIIGGRSRLEYPIGRVLYETDGWISHPHVSPDGGQVAFIEHPVFADDRGFVTLVSREAGAPPRRLTREWASANGLAWVPGGKELWFTAADVGANCALRAVSLSGDERLLLRSAGRLELQDVRGDGQALLTDGKFRIGMMHHDRRRGGDRDLSWLDVSVVADLSADGLTLLFSEQGSGGGTHGYALYGRKSDGSAAVRLGEGLAGALSPDGRWATSVMLGSPPHLVLWPTGAGPSRTLEHGGLTDLTAVNWLPDGRHLLFSASLPGRSGRLHVQDVEGGAPQPVSAEGVRVPFYSKPVSPDGRFTAALDAQGRVILQPLDGGTPQVVEGLAPGDVPIRWSGDGAALYVFRFGELPGRIQRFDLATRRKELAAELVPSDPAGAGHIISVQITPDGQAWAYSYRQNLADLYLVGGLR